MITTHYRVVVQVNLMLNFQVQQQLREQSQMMALRLLQGKKMLVIFNLPVVSKIVLQVDQIVVYLPSIHQQQKLRTDP